MKHRMSYVLLVLLLLSGHVYGQGTLQITFDQPTPQPPGTAVLIHRYDESGMTFTPIGMEGFVRTGGASNNFLKMAPPICRPLLQNR